MMNNQGKSYDNIATAKKIRQGSFVINDQIYRGYDSGRVFRHAFYKMIGVVSSNTCVHSELVLKASWIDTLLGSMIAISDDDSLYLLEFVDRIGLEKEIDRLRKRQKADIILGSTEPIVMIKNEVGLYFSGNLKSFKTPLHLIGSDFQRCVWHALQQIPYGETRSYKSQAEITGNERAYRAVANANGANQLAIIIPCHRIINHNGELGGYRGGAARKEWLLKHEKLHA